MDPNLGSKYFGATYLVVLKIGSKSDGGFKIGLKYGPKNRICLKFKAICASKTQFVPNL